MPSDGHLSLEVGVTEPASCPACGRPTVRSTGFIYRDGDAHAIYHILLHAEGAPEGDLALGIGRWDSDDAVGDASAFLALAATEDSVTFTFVDAAQSAWSGSRRLGHQLAPTEARTGRRRTAFLECAELVVRDDPAVAHILSH